jgi:hypothetical protein
MKSSKTLAWRKFSVNSFVMYVPGRHGGAEQRERMEWRGQRGRRRTGVGFSLCAAPSCPCALYFGEECETERSGGLDSMKRKQVENKAVDKVDFRTDDTSLSMRVYILVAVSTKKE